ncbi:Threonine/homoserine efflux transporter RhtA [Alteromonadaceae bacterium Bs31]|nr:Threonine/homoserine efflux transporter RhtA [Alteromonadaceae bacterium Bs31]
MKTVIYTCLALLAFAGNSVLCRLALGEQSLDAASFTAIRLLSGAAFLGFILVLNKPRSKPPARGQWKASALLFIYALTFSFAYVSLDTGTGALVLFTSVQITMILWGVCKGHTLQPLEWLGTALAFVGFIYLISPELSTPSLKGFVLMAVSGLAWGLYSLAGKNSNQPLADTAFNFVRTLPLVLLVLAVATPDINLSWRGVLLAAISGALASGAGYTIWYLAMRGLSTVQAAVVQLLVPVIAALGGALFASELLSLHFIISSLIILGGILTVILAKQIKPAA